MLIIIYLMFILIGFMLLIKGAEELVKGASTIAKKFNIPEILIGLTIVAIGTSMPEIIITITSAMQGKTEFILGNVIGGTLCNLLLILGIISIIKPIKIDKETKKIHLPMAICASIILFIMSFSILSEKTNIISSKEGIILIFVCILYLLYPIKIEIKDILETYRKKKIEKQIEINYNKQKETKANIISILSILIGIVFLKIGGDLVVNSSEAIAKTYNISQTIVGLTIIAIGTALPELVTAIIATIKKETDLAIGNLVGSSILNLLLISGIGAIISPLIFNVQLKSNLIFVIFSIILIWILTFVGKKSEITRAKGIIFLFLYAIYIINIFV